MVSLILIGSMLVGQGVQRGEVHIVSPGSQAYYYNASPLREVPEIVDTDEPVLPTKAVVRDVMGVQLKSMLADAVKRLAPAQADAGVEGVLSRKKKQAGGGMD